jgi:hypothetical protein
VCADLLHSLLMLVFGEREQSKPSSAALDICNAFLEEEKHIKEAV